MIDRFGRESGAMNAAGAVTVDEQPSQVGASNLPAPCQDPLDIDSTVPVQIRNLACTYPAVGLDSAEKKDDEPPILNNLNWTVNKGQRILVVGGNGAGKSTLLRIVAGKHLTPQYTSYVYGRDAYRDCRLNDVRSYVSCEFDQRTVAISGQAVAYSTDMAVEEMNAKLQSDYPERKKKLLKVLRINPKWRLHRLSDGQRRRVQLFMCLLKPTPLIVLDEVLGVMDIISRQDFLKFLIEESEQRYVTILFATNVFDGLEDWATELLYIRNGDVGYYGPFEKHPEYQRQLQIQKASPIMRTVGVLLRTELEEETNRAP